MNKGLYTQVSLDHLDISFTHENPVLSIGSCFSEKVVQRLKHGGFNCCINPHGILFDPLSCNKALTDLIDCKQYKEEDLTKTDSQFVSTNHHGSFHDDNSNNLLLRINKRIDHASKYVTNDSIIVITWGTAFAWEREGEIVGNCHRLPADNFIKRLIQPKEIIEKYALTLDRLKNESPGLKVVLTVSPVRYVKEGLVNNGLSKAHLVKAAHELQRQFDNISYFPSFEIFNDELRDYRFYNSDLIHPNDTGINYVFDRFLESSMSDSAREVVYYILKQSRVFSHRPTLENDEAFTYARKKAFDLIVNRLLVQYPEIGLEYLSNNFTA